MRRTRVQGREAKNRTQEEGGWVKTRKKPQRCYGRHVEKGGDLDCRRRKPRQANVGSVDVDRGYLENGRGEEREAQERVSPLCRV